MHEFSSTYTEFDSEGSHNTWFKPIIRKNTNRALVARTARRGSDQGPNTALSSRPAWCGVHKDVRRACLGTVNFGRRGKMGGGYYFTLIGVCAYIKLDHGCE